METPQGFTKVADGRYTKGDYEYVINPTTGEVSARALSGSGGETNVEEEDEDLAYLKSYLENKDITEVMDMSEAAFTDPNVIYDFETAEAMELDSPEPGEEFALPIKYHEKIYLIYILMDEDTESALITRVIVATGPAGNLYRYSGDVIDVVACVVNDDYIFLSLQSGHSKLCNINNEPNLFTFSNNESDLTLNHSELVLENASIDENITLTRTYTNYTYSPEYNSNTGIYNQAIYYDSTNQAYLYTFYSSGLFFSNDAKGILDDVIYYQDLSTYCIISNNGETITIAGNAEDTNGTYTLLDPSFFD